MPSSSMINAPALEVDLAALAENYQRLSKRFSGGACAGVVKADAYGLGMVPVARALQAAGCELFFVATLEEAVALRAALADITIGVFHGNYAGEEKEYIAHRLLPVISSPEQLVRWLPLNAPYMLHVDSGINRLGLTQGELEAHLTPLTNHKPQLLLSHLACANDPHDSKNAEQLQRFQTARALLPGVKASLCNSSGIFLDKAFHFDVARPGCALYGINPTEKANPMRHVATLSAPIMQIRQADREDTVGYSATYPVRKGARLAVAQLGYADGYLRHLSNKGQAVVAGMRVSIAGRVSMDMIVLDVSDVSEKLLTPDLRAEFICADLPVDEVASTAGTIGYEVFSRLGARVKRVYTS